MRAAEGSSEEPVPAPGAFVVETRVHRAAPEALTMVGLGASAGGFAALESFFRAMPADSGLVFVVVLHLAPEHDSSLAAVLQRFTAMRVVQAENGRKVEANCVYVIPPGKLLCAVDGCLRLEDLPPRHGRLVTVDAFLRTLAESHGARAVAVIFSGADGDGALGMTRIKERGGLTMAQAPAEAEHPDMPQAAIATGMVDWVLAAAEMPRRILDYLEQGHRIALPPAESPAGASEPFPAAVTAESALQGVIALLHEQTGRDFSYYKRGTILRRIARRMQMNALKTLPDYLAFLRQEPAEAPALLQDLLISVTNFFRDPEAFRALERQIPDLFQGKGSADVVKAWVTACATGEEAYTVAMLLTEYAQRLPNPPRLQVFATDLDERAIKKARLGAYPATIGVDVAEERLARFFIRDFHGYRIRREIREIVLFAVHDLVADSPFSKVDLVTCRNLLIYLDRSAQAKVLDLLHFALRSGGRLLIGASETLTEEDGLFSPSDKLNRLYAPKDVPQARIAAWSSLPFGRGGMAAAPGAPARRTADPLGRPGSWAELHRSFVEKAAAPSVLVDRDHRILHVAESAAAFLRFAPGEPTHNLLSSIHPLLRLELREALLRAVQSHAAAETGEVRLALDGTVQAVTLRVHPFDEGDASYLLVDFETRDVSSSDPLPPAPNPKADPISEHLERDLEQTKAHLREVVEQYETSNEEFKAGNEELQASNEELVTGREELQSVSEELTAVNQELKGKVDELARANADLRNLIGATAIGTVFVDHDLRITRYTPAAVALFRLIPTDVGRPLTDLTPRLNYPDLARDVAAVLESLAPIEKEVAGEPGASWFLARILPYRTVEDEVAGVVLTFVDVSRLRQAEADLRASAAQLKEQLLETRRSEAARRTLLGRVLAAHEEERARISRGLHDEVGQTLTALLLELKALASGADAGGATSRLLTLCALADGIGRDIHELALELRPASLDDSGLAGALSNYAEGWSHRTGVKVEMHAAGIEGKRLPRETETTLYRIVREALNNVAKHAGATQVSIVLDRHGNHASAVIEDDGRGFDVAEDGAAPAARGIGLAGMRERAALVGGELTVESGQGQGTAVYVRLPLIQEAGDA